LVLVMGFFCVFSLAVVMVKMSLLLAMMMG
jgi:hypothetical protein